MAKPIVYIKTFSAVNKEKIDAEVNDFKKDKKIIAVQTHVNINPRTEDILYTYIAYFEVWE